MLIYNNKNDKHTSSTGMNDFDKPQVLTVETTEHTALFFGKTVAKKVSNLWLSFTGCLKEFFAFSFQKLNWSQT